MNRGEAIKTGAIKSAYAALAMDCFLCQAPGHIAKDCLHCDAIAFLIHCHNHEGKGCSNVNVNGTNMQPNAASSTAMPANDKPAYQEAARVAGASLSHDSHNADVWLYDSRASSSMSNNCSTFSSFRPDQHVIRLVDGKVIHSKGIIGTVQLLSENSYFIIIHDVLFIPLLAINLFAANRFAREHHNNHLEVMEYPTCKWINHGTGTVEFTATIQHDNLVYLDWRIAPQLESANLSIMELHV